MVRASVLASSVSWVRIPPELSSEKKELFGLVAFPFFLFIEKSFHVITQLGVWRLWWFNYPGPLL